MKSNRRWFLRIAGLLLPLLVVVIARGAQEETRIRWDIVDINFTNFNLSAGGQASALAENLSKITMTGSGTFVPGDPEDVSGGGSWEIRDKNGSLIGSGAYKVKQLVRFELAPGALGPPLVDKIGNAADARAGLAVLRIRYSDGSQGILVVSCRISRQTPDSMFEGITASKGFMDFWSHAAQNFTIFHVVPDSEDRDRD